MFQKMESCPSVRCPWSLARDSWKSLAPLVVECYDTIALCCWQMYFQVLQPDLKAVEKLAWMIPFLQVHAGTRRVWQPGRPLVRTVMLIWVYIFFLLRVLLGTQGAAVVMGLDFPFLKISIWSKA